MGVTDFLISFISAVIDFHSSLSPTYQKFVTLFSLVVAIVIYTILFWKLRLFISKKNLFNFDLNKYNRTESKILASLFYFLEYALIVPFFVFFWFVIFTFSLMIFIEDLASIQTIMLISAITIGAIRMISYMSKSGGSLAEELASLLPITFLAIALAEPSVFVGLGERMSLRISEFLTSFSGMRDYLIFIVLLELVLRFFEFLFGIMKVGDEEEKE